MMKWLFKNISKGIYEIMKYWGLWVTWEILAMNNIFAKKVLPILERTKDICVKQFFQMTLKYALFLLC